MARTGSPSIGARFIGRERELDRLGVRLEAALASHGGLVVLSGAPGSGLTSIAAKTGERAQSWGFDVVWGDCLEGTLGRPFAGLADALETHALTLPRNQVTADLGPDAGPILRFCPALTGVVPAFAPAVPLEPADERLRLHEAITAWVGRMAARAPLLIVVDGAADMDDDLAELLGAIAGGLRRLPVLVLICGPVRAAVAASALETIEVTGLDEGATSALLAERAERPVPHEAALLIHQVSAGNPLLTLELWRHVREEEMLPDFGPPDLPAAEALPQTLEEVEAWRLARLEPDARAAVNAVAAFPGGISGALAAAVSGVSRTRVVVVLESAVQAGLVSVDHAAGLYVVPQPAIRKGMLFLLSPGDRERLHRRVANVLEEEAGERLRGQAGVVAHHYARSRSLDSREKGVHHFLLAAEQARAAFAYHRAAACTAEALSLASERDRRLQADVMGRLAVNQAAAGQRDESLATARRLLESVPPGVAIPDDVVNGVTDTLRALRGQAEPRDDWPALDELRRTLLARAARVDALARARLEFMAEHWRIIDIAGIPSLQWSALDQTSPRILEGGDDTDRAEILLAQRPRTQPETARIAEIARTARRPQSTLRSLRCVVTDALTRGGLFREGAGWARQYLAAAQRFGSTRDEVRALLFLSRAEAALGELAAARATLGRALDVMSPVATEAPLLDEVVLTRCALAYYLDADWAELRHELPSTLEVGPVRARPSGLLLEAQGVIADGRLDFDQRAEFAMRIPALLEAASQVPPLTLHRDAALLATLAATWELGAAEHAAAGRSLLDLAAQAGAGGQIEGTIGLNRGRMLALAGDVTEARRVFAAERTSLEAAGLAPLRAIVDYDEGIAIAAAGDHHYTEATHLFESAALAFEALGMTGWHARTGDLLARGLQAAAAPGGRLHFTYPRGLTRREADVVRLISNGASSADAAAALVLEPGVVERLLNSALEKLGAERREELPRLARRYGLGGV